MISVTFSRAVSRAVGSLANLEDEMVGLLAKSRRDSPSAVSARFVTPFRPPQEIPLRLTLNMAKPPPEDT